MILALKHFYTRFFPASVRNFLGDLRIKDRIFIAYFKSRDKKLVKRLSKKETISVAFVCMDVAFWKYDKIFSLMQSHPLFDPSAILVPRPDLDAQLKGKCLEEMELYFKKKQFPYTQDIEKFKADIIFYAQPYKTSVPDSLSVYNLPNTLFCYIPYAFWVSNYRWGYDQFLHNVAWKLFYPTSIHKENAFNLALNKGENVCVTGYPLADVFLEKQSEAQRALPWSEKNDQRKKIIWAAHNSVIPNKYSDCSTFLQYADKFLDLAEKYQDQVVIAFKPHPILKHNLYLHPQWGKQRTDEYFHKWESLPNTFIATGDYIELFKQSDALMHDCGSFTAEYLYTQKPCLFIGPSRDKVYCKFGLKALDVHYSLNDCNPEDFIKDVVIDGKDPKEEKRKAFFDDYLLPPHNQTVAQNVLQELLKGLHKC